MTCSVDQTSSRVKQLSAMFDVPALTETKFEAHGEIDLDPQKRDWQIGLIVGPSGSGKTSLLNQIYPSWDFVQELEWTSKAVIDDFAEHLSIEEITSACSSVGFNTIPSWLRSFPLLSNGEQFRARMARLLCERPQFCVVDEFTSVVDRQVAKIVASCIQKYIRRKNAPLMKPYTASSESPQRFIAASCHYDIIEWLQPDWIIQMPELQLTWRSLQRRPPIYTWLDKVPYRAWNQFAPFHYMSADLNKAARCYGLWVTEDFEGRDLRLASFCGVLHRPHPRVRDINGVSRVVTLPDFQGLGLAMALLDKLGSAFMAVGKRFRNYPAHPSFIRSHRKSFNWKEVKEAGAFSPRRGESSTVAGFGGRPCGVFEYQGPPMEEKQARSLLGL